MRKSRQARTPTEFAQRLARAGSSAPSADRGAAPMTCGQCENQDEASQAAHPAHARPGSQAPEDPRRVAAWRRPPEKPGAVSRSTRPSERADIPQHVTLRVEDGVLSLARGGRIQIIRRAIWQSQKSDFQIVEFNVLGNHLHLITQANGKSALSRGVAGLEVRLAHRLNSALSRSGK